MTRTSATVSLRALNRMPRREFTRTLDGVFENSPWVAERAWDARPFATVADLHAALVAVVRRAPADEQIALLRAHPDLAGKAARAGALSAASAREQATAGLDRLTDEEYERFQALNDAYRGRFGFPFIIAVRQHDKAGILTAFESRLRNSVEQEMVTALGHVSAITRLRVDELVRGA
jgi:2-oxo-4-hydroxy-4-carboxy-5-ureidoimidazoline decarboxylase